MQKLMIALLAGALLVSCNNKPGSKYFEVSGTILNSNAKWVYLEKVSAAAMQPVLEDSAKLEKDGKFILHAKPDESVVFNLRLDQSMYPVASVINDTDKVKLTIELNKQNGQFAEKYDVQGSPASLAMKDFMFAFNNDLQTIFGITMQADSLQKASAPDSVLFPLLTKQRELAQNVKQLTLTALEKATDPALAMFELGYYQSTANANRFGLEPLPNDKVNELVAAAAKKFPDHHAVADIKKGLEEDAQRLEAANWVGKEAPDFSIPDVNGAEVKLSSFRGKFVLVDFWASWCGPCRAENPNIVKAYDKFKGKNFTILGVSLDRPGQKDKWLKAIKDDKLAWTHVSELQYWQSPVVELFHFNEIPFNLLIDPQGKVIAQGLRGSQLEEKLGEVIR
ncbi:MAG: alkyl hydroperoxide reductase [Citrobacter freundii]|nr:MAG: alkyl hydroperoxide reductase [Citrobacter freundii]